MKVILRTRCGCTQMIETGKKRLSGEIVMALESRPLYRKNPDEPSPYVRETRSFGYAKMDGKTGLAVYEEM